MPFQTTLEGNSFSDGVSFEVSTDDGTNWIDVGVMDSGYSYTYNFTAAAREWGNAEKSKKIAKVQSVTIAPTELGTWDADVFAAISSGMFTTEAVVGPPAGTLIKFGSSSTELEPVQVRMTHYTTDDPISNPDDYDFRHTIYKVSLDDGGLTFTKNGAKSDADNDTWTVALTGEAESTRDDGHQVDDVFIAS